MKLFKKHTAGMTAISPRHQRILKLRSLLSQLIHLQNYVVTMLMRMVLFFQVETDHDHILLMVRWSN